MEPDHSPPTAGRPPALPPQTSSRSTSPNTAPSRMWCVPGWAGGGRASLLAGGCRLPNPDGFPVASPSQVVMKDRVTKRPRGFGFITFSDPSAAQAACSETHTIDGRQVRAAGGRAGPLPGVASPVTLFPRGWGYEHASCPPQIDAKPSVPHGEGSQPPRSKKIFVGGLAPETDDSEWSRAGSRSESHPHRAPRPHSRADAAAMLRVVCTPPRLLHAARSPIERLLRAVWRGGRGAGHGGPQQRTVAGLWVSFECACRRASIGGGGAGAAQAPGLEQALRGDMMRVAAAKRAPAALQQNPSLLPLPCPRLRGPPPHLVTSRCSPSPCRRAVAPVAQLCDF